MEAPKKAMLLGYCSKHGNPWRIRHWERRGKENGTVTAFFNHDVDPVSIEPAT
jgi:hypothetical protein